MSQSNKYQKCPADSIAGPCKHRTLDQSCSRCILDVSQQFSDMTIEDKRDMQKYMQLKYFKRHESLYHQSESCDQLFILISGDAKIFKSLPNGYHQLYNVVHTPGELVGREDLLHEQHENSAEALGDVCVCCVNRDELRNSGRQYKFLS